MQQNVQNVHNMCCVRRNLPGLVDPFAADRIWSCVLLIYIFVLAASMLCLEFFDAISISLQLSSYLGFVEFPSVALSESWMVLLSIEINNVAKDRHERQEKAKYIVAVQVSTILHQGKGG